MDVEGSVREFLNEQVASQGEKREIRSDESLLDSGVLDSASILEIVSFLEERFRFTIDDEELVPENFETINSIVRLVKSKNDGQPARGDAAS